MIAKKRDSSCHLSVTGAHHYRYGKPVSVEGGTATKGKCKYCGKRVTDYDRDRVGPFISRQRGLDAGLRKRKGE